MFDRFFKTFFMIVLALIIFSSFAVEACQICCPPVDAVLAVLQGMLFSWWFLLIVVLAVSLLCWGQLKT